MSHDPPNSSQVGQQVIEMAGEAGFALAGIARAAPSDHAEHIRAWLAGGKHGEMGYLANHLAVRLDPEKLLEGAKSILIVADLHAAHAPEGDEATREAGGDGPARGRIARYAWGDDYHKLIKKRLHGLCDRLLADHPSHTFRAAVDTAPLLEREHAARAGLGWIGKNTLLIHPKLGSYMLLGAIVTTLELPTSDDLNFPAGLVPPADHCGTCTRCIDACPTQCIEDPAKTGRRALNASRCISYLTLEHRSPIAPALHPLMGDWLAGCDICQEVCPFNRRRQRGDADAAQTPIQPGYEPRETFAAGPALLDVLNWSPEDRQQAFIRSALKRVKLDMLKRNALIAAGNALRDRPDETMLERIRELAADEAEPESVRSTAEQVLAWLSSETGT